MSQTLCCEYYVPTANSPTVFNTVNPNTVFSMVNSNTVFNTVNFHTLKEHF